MKTISLLAFLCSVSLFCKAQDTRWMYLANDKNKIYLVDTVRDDIKHYDIFEGHENVVSIWANFYNRVKSANGAYVINTELIRFIVDTSEKQVEMTSDIKYRNGISKGNNVGYGWEDIIPGSVGELYLQYVKSLKNMYLKGDILLNSIMNYNPYAKPKKQ